MTRTGLSPRLSRHRPEPLLEIHPRDAAELGLRAGDFADVITDSGSSLYRVHPTDAQRRGEVFVPMHWTDATSAGGRTGRLPLPDCDPISGQPGFKRTPATIVRRSLEWHGFLVARARPASIDTPYWTAIRTEGGWIVELAGDDIAAAASLLPGGTIVEALDGARGMIRRASIGADGRLAGALFVTRNGSLPPRDWIAAQLTQSAAPSAPSLLAGRPAGTPIDQGPIICICFDIGVKTILAAIAGQGLASVEEVRAAIGAGGNCGSCRPAIGGLIDEQKARAHG